MAGQRDLAVQRDYQRERNAQRRARGVCISCPLPSERFWRCPCCRLLWADKQREYARAYYRRHRDEVNAKRREAYRLSKTSAQGSATVASSVSERVSCSVAQHV